MVFHRAAETLTAPAHAHRRRQASLAAVAVQKLAPCLQPLDCFGALPLATAQTIGILRCRQTLKVDIPAGLPDKANSGRIPVIRATPGYFSLYERAKSAHSGADGCVLENDRGLHVRGHSHRRQAI